MGASDVNLAELIGSRICHDLISPIGAITNGLELLDMVGAVQGPEMELISGSVGSAGARIRFFRVAFGSASDQPLGRAEITELLNDVERAGRVRVNWNLTEPVPRNQVKLAFLALMCCESAMPLGGTVDVTSQGANWNVTGSADKLNVDSDLWKHVVTERFPNKLTPAQVQFALLPETAKTMGRRVAAETTATRVSLRF
ncbi:MULTISPECIES: histidine phosphotransferase family protein [unclassified Ruegeria]|uniref:histidine phosphotransferase family protein n=1 Tax=unclassified Ruegeria TaxID=2625375 RepID=UPI001488051C|nr:MULTISPECIES: histidine phosphotransferase family protein [unclassified Ruegeria]NOD87396.1 histidine phosphotransferase [Ruegeria sp. HKCCD4318]NOE12951.1 histidine phosphotransferase [Ruegeria sp. HKCCD4318-2]NOG08882.1 histidine phosphotransferase [Ruegeria sp. HKCCD4315]